MQVSTTMHHNALEIAFALLIYKTRDPKYGNSDATSFVTKHPVELINGRPTVRPGTPLTDHDYEMLVDSVSKVDAREANAWIDPNVLARAGGRTIWWSPPKTRTLFFDAKRDLKVSGVCPLPGLIFSSNGEDLYVFAVKGKNRPTPETLLYQAPFFNVYSNGNVCLGNGRRPKNDQGDFCLQWEKDFFDSRFTHPNVNEENELIKGSDAFTFWDALIKQPPAKFPEKVLVDINLKVSSLVNTKNRR